MRSLLMLMIAAVVVISASMGVSAQQRVALVIGNADYQRVAKLANPTNDAESIEALLAAAKFDQVTRLANLDVTQMRRALRDFAALARQADIAVVYYSGHGIEVNGINYLVPVDAVLQQDIDAPDEAISLERVLDLLEGTKTLRLVVLDACRDNPFTNIMKRTMGSRSIGRGFAEVRQLPTNTLVAFATKHGTTASDGTGRNSPYTEAMIKHLTIPGLDVQLALRRVRDDVILATKASQEPFVYGSMGGAEVPLVARPPPLAVMEKPNPTAPTEDLANDPIVRPTFEPPKASRRPATIARPDGGNSGERPPRLPAFGGAVPLN